MTVMSRIGTRRGPPYRLLAAALLALTLAGPLASAQTESLVAGVVHRLESRYRGARAFRAAFLERRSEGARSMQVESGTLYLQRPGLMRWDYEAPEPKLFLVDGKYAWFYVPADRSVSKAPVRQSADELIPLLLLTGKVKLGRLCRRIELADVHVMAAGNTALRCLPARAAADEYREAVLEINSSDYLVRLLLREPGEVETEFQFGRWQENPDLPAGLFHFSPPQGTTIVDEQTLLRGFDQK